MAVVYIFHLTLNIDQLYTGIRSVFDTVNDIMKSSGDHGRLSWRGRGLDFKVTADRTLTEQELKLLSDTILNEFNQHFPNWNVAIDSTEIRING